MTPAWHDTPLCLDHIVCGRGNPGIEGDSPTGTPIESWLDFVRCDDFPCRTLVAANRAQRHPVATAISKGLILLQHEFGSSKTLQAIKHCFQERDSVVLFVPVHNVVVRFQPRWITDGTNVCNSGVTDISVYQMQQERQEVMRNTPCTVWFPTSSAAGVDDKWLCTDAFAQTLNTLGAVAPIDSLPTSAKGGDDHIEPFEVTNPKYFVEWLLPTLAAASPGCSEAGDALSQTRGENTTNSAALSAGVIGHVVRKTVHDNVVHRGPQNNALPWRRDPLYCGLNAVVHADFVSTLGPHLGRVCYKINRLLYFAFVWLHLEPQLVGTFSTDAQIGQSTAFLVKMNRRFVKLQHDVDMLAREVATATLVSVVSNDDIHSDMTCIEKVLTRARASLDAVWLQRASAPITIKSVSGGTRNPFEEHLQAFIGHPDLAARIEEHTDDLNATACRIATASKSTYKPSKAETLAGCDSSYAAVLRAEELFDWMLNHPNRDSGVAEEVSVTSLHDELKRLDINDGADRNPIVRSRGILMAFILFIRIDRAVGKEHAFILQYDTSVTSAIVHALTLPSARWRKVVSIIEADLQRRNENREPLHDDHCAFHQRAAMHPQYQKQVEDFIKRTLAWQEQQIEDKMEEVRKARQKKKELPAIIARTEEHYYSCNRSGRYMGCDLCRMRSELSYLPVAPFTRVLPASGQRQRIIAFEMIQPKEILLWRDAAVCVNTKALGREYTSPGDDANEWLEHMKYSGMIGRSADASVSPVVKLVSTVKWMTHCHFVRGRCTDGIDCDTVDSAFIKVNGGTTYLAAADPDASCSTAGLHMSLSEGSSYQALQQCISLPRSNSCNQNYALAHQDKCPEAVALNEFVAFGSVRSGGLVQHFNLLRMLTSDALTFSHPDVLILVLSTLWEAGEAASDNQWWRRADVHSFRRPVFIHRVLDACVHLLDSARDQWERPWTVAVVAVVVARCVVPDSAEHAAVNARSVKVLQDCRATSALWLVTQTARLRLDASTGELELQDSIQRTEMLFSIAIVGLLSFLPVIEYAQTFAGLEGTIIDALLGPRHTNEATVSLAQLLTLKESLHSKMPKALPVHMRPIVSVIKHICAALHPCVHNRLQNGESSGLTTYTARLCSLIDGNELYSWEKATPSDGNVWFCTKSASGETVEVNTVTGAVLVNGDREGNVPARVHSSAAFQQLFGERPLIVQNAGRHTWTTLPTEGAPTFVFQCHDTDVVIEMILADQQRWRLLPKMKNFSTLLPRRLLELHSHWACDGRVCFLPLSFTIETLNAFNLPDSASPFLCRYLEESSKTFVVQDGSTKDTHDVFLGNHKHPITRFCQETLSRAELQEFTHVWWKGAKSNGVDVDQQCVQDGTVCVEATRIQLEFEAYVDTTLHALALKSVFNPGFRVAANQNFGALLGLNVGLLLETVDGGNDRQLIVPVCLNGYSRGDGGVNGHSVRLGQDQSPTAMVSTFRYKLNEPLRQLCGPADTSAALYLAYLHAISSSFQLQPEPWTGMTGMEAAVAILRSPRVQRHEPYTDMSNQILSCIAELTPSRVWYPSHLRVMQTADRTSAGIPAEVALEAYRELAGCLRRENAELGSLFDPDKPCIKIRHKSDSTTPRSYRDTKPDLNTRSALLHTRRLPAGCILPEWELIGTSEGDDVMFDEMRVPSCRMSGKWIQVAAEFALPEERRARCYGLDQVSALELTKCLWPTSESHIMSKDRNARFVGGWLFDIDENMTEYGAPTVQAQCKVHFLTLLDQIVRAASTEENLFLLSSLKWKLQSDLADSRSAFDVLRGLVHCGAQNVDLHASVGQSPELVQYFNKETWEHLQVMNNLVTSYKKEYTYSHGLRDHVNKECEEAFNAEAGRQHEKMCEILETTVETIQTNENQASWRHGARNATPLQCNVLNSKYFDTASIQHNLRAYLCKMQRELQVLRFVEGLVEMLNEVTPPAPQTVLMESTFDYATDQGSREQSTKIGKTVSPTWYYRALSPARPQNDVMWMPAPQLPVAPWDVLPGTSASAGEQHNFGDCADAAGASDILSELLLDHVSEERLDPLTQELNSRARASVERLCEVGAPKPQEFSLEVARTYYIAVQRATHDRWALMEQSFTVPGVSLHANRVSPSSLVHALMGEFHPAGSQRRALIQFTDKGKDALVELMRLWVLQQKAVRMLHFHQVNNTVWLHNECCNPPHGKWNPGEHVLWLCLELESNIAIWDRQYDVCQKMRGEASPHTDGSAPRHRLVQLNMGEGKTSVILPMLAACLGDGDNLCRVVVPRELLRGNADTLSLALGGLLGRKVFSVPFNRDVTLTQTLVDSLLMRYTMCQKNGDIILTTPESILSFQLKFAELANGFPSTITTSEEPEEDSAEDKTENMQQKLKLAQSTARVQRFILDYGREVLDEADSILHYKRQLVYTMGQRQSPDGEHLRWNVILQVMLAVFHTAARLEENFGAGVVELHHFGDVDGAVMVPRLLETSEKSNAVWEWLRTSVLDHLIQCAHDLLPVMTPQTLHTVKLFVLRPELTAEQIEEFYGVLELSTTTIATLEILRGLFSYDVLRLALTKRWRVDFGVDYESHRRHMNKEGTVELQRKIAVPFEAKDTAKPNTEFGHVDIAITLTILSYSRSGLKNTELEALFEHLYGKAEPEQRYLSILEDGVSSRIDERFASLKLVSRTDPKQWGTLCDHLRGRYGVVKYFLDAIVFPHEVKQYSEKLVATPWDLGNRCKARPLSGFSGTNDTEWLLPPTVEQQDIPALGDTNARVLAAVMREENNQVERLSADYDECRQEILSLLQRESNKSRRVNVLLDVGALLLEDNMHFAQEWLQRRPECKGVVLYADNLLVVLDRHDHRVPLTVSPLAGNLNACLVLLDEAHCRGTDLQLPTGSVAALTLGRGLTRDKFVQAALRMRALISGQHSLVFLAAAEVHMALTKLAAGCGLAGADDAGTVTNRTVVRWTLQNTRTALFDGVSHWVSQSVFSSAADEQMIRMFRTTDTDPTAASLECLGRAMRSQDAVKLRTSYGQPRALLGMAEVCDTVYPHRTLDSNDTAVQPEHPWVCCVRDKCAGLFSAAPKRHRNALVDEEQERELERQIEEERHVDRPACMTPAPAAVDPALRRSIQQARIDPQLCTLGSLFASGRLGTTAMTLADVWHPDLRCTQPFCNALKPAVASLQEFLRPVAFVVHFGPDTAGRGAGCVLVSPHEAGMLVRDLVPGRTTQDVTVVLRMVAARTKSNDLDVWEAPGVVLVHGVSADTDAAWQQQHIQRSRLLLTQLHLFAGSTHFVTDQARDHNDDEHALVPESLEQQMLVATTLGLCCGPRTDDEARAWSRGCIHRDGFVPPASRRYSDKWVLSPSETPSPAVPVTAAMRSFLTTTRGIGAWLGRTPLGHLLGNPPVHYFARDVAVPDGGDGDNINDAGHVQYARRCAADRLMTADSPVSLPQQNLGHKNDLAVNF
eukprot:m.787177 g.787177  ORF g.787177 m.787177 type:complete len:3447 (+) comp23307_c0_seq1:163-10503(+)